MTSESTLSDQARPLCNPNTNLLAIEANNASSTSISDSTKHRNIFEGHESENDPRFTQLKHYLSMLTCVLKEVDDVKYLVEPPSRSRLRVTIHDTFDQEMYYLAHPFGDGWLKLVKDHFASLVADSRDKWNPYARPSVPIPMRWVSLFRCRMTLLITK